LEVKSLGFFVVRLQANSIQVVICTPTAIGEKSDGSNPLDTDLDAYSAVIRRLPNEGCTGGSSNGFHGLPQAA